MNFSLQREKKQLFNIWIEAGMWCGNRQLEKSSRKEEIWIGLIIKKNLSIS